MAKKKNPKYYVEKEKQRIQLQLKEQELLKSLNQLRMDHHPVHHITKFLQSDKIKQANLPEEVSRFVNSPDLQNRMSSAQVFFSDFLVYIAGYFASDKYSKHLLKKKKKKKMKAQLKKELRELRRLEEEGSW